MPLDAGKIHLCLSLLSHKRITISLSNVNADGKHARHSHRSIIIYSSMVIPVSLLYFDQYFGRIERCVCCTSETKTRC
jgi:hypothetical protein